MLLPSFTESQKKLICGIPVFLKSDQPLMIVKGYAGTGKTFMIRQIAQMLADQKISFSLMAPTGRAAKVLTSKSGFRAYTIHKSIYNVEHMTEIKNGDKLGEESFLYYFKIRNNEDNLRHVYIVDESSMVSDNYNSGEFFRYGSGKLLSDLIFYTGVRSFKERKIIFVGDDAQLPPVNSSLSPALSNDYLLTTFRIPSVEYELTDIVRQSGDSAILKAATKIRESVKNGIYNEISISSSDRQIIPSCTDSVVSDYLLCAKKYSQEETVIIAYANKAVSEYNEMIRNVKFPGQKTIRKSDRIMVVANNYNKEIELLNGESGTVVSVSDNAEVRRTPVFKDDEKNYVEITYRDALIRFRDIYNKERDVSCKIIENLLYSSESDLSSDEIKALYIDFKIRNKHLKPGTPEFREALMTDPYFNALRIKFGYAVTCHKAQGGEWKNVIVDFQTKTGKLNENYFRWVYTAITRSKEVLYTINPPCHNAFTFSGKTENVDAASLGVISISGNLHSETEIIPEDNFKGKPQFLKSFYSAILSICLKYRAIIKNLEHYDYCERYFISKDKNIYCVNVTYNKEGRITRIESLQSRSRIEDKHLLEKLLNEISAVQGKYIAAGVESTSEILFPEDKPYLEIIYNKLSECLGKYGISVNKVEHLNWRERYLLSRDGNIARIDLTYNSKGIIGSIQSDVDKSSSVELLNEILHAVSILRGK